MNNLTLLNEKAADHLSLLSVMFHIVFQRPRTSVSGLTHSIVKQDSILLRFNSLIGEWVWNGEVFFNQEIKIESYNFKNWIPLVLSENWQKKMFKNGPVNCKIILKILKLLSLLQNAVDIKYFFPWHFPQGHLYFKSHFYNVTYN